MADVDVKFGGSIAALTDAVDQAIELLGGFKESADKVSESLRSIGELVGISFSVEGIKAFVDTFAELGEQTERMADIFGTTTQEVGLLNFAAAETGGSGEALMRSLERLSLSLQQAQDKVTPTTAAIRALGLDAKTLSELPLPDMLDKMREKFSQLPEGLERTAVAQALVRNGAEQLLPILEMSGEKWDELRSTFTATGSAMSQEMAKGFAETSDRITTFKAALEGAGERIFAVLKPAIDAALDSMTKFVESLNSKGIAEGLGAVTDIVIESMESMAHFFAEVGKEIDKLIIQLEYLKEYRLSIFNDDIAAEMNSKISAMNAGVDAGLAKTEAMFASWSKQIHGYIDSAVGPEATVGDRAAELQAALGGGTGGALDFTNYAAQAKKAADDAAKAMRDAAKKAQDAWNETAGKIASDLTSAFSGIIGGTETVGQAFEKMGLSMLTQVAQNALKSIIASAGQTFAGVFAFLSPTMGPAAVAPAGAAEASVLAAANVLSLDVGTWNVSRDSMAQIHQGEVVMPRFESSIFRNAMSSLAGGGAQQGAGGDTHNHTHYHGPIFDARGLLRTLGEAARLNKSVSPWG